jgi:predicted DsbA family dithiol-disulfide isomerase
MKAVRIDFVSDVVCPWCVIGLKALEQALDKASDVVTADIHFQPFELNPQMPPEGQNIAEHVAQKYGADPERSRGTRDLIRNSAAALGFTINSGPDSRIWNTFDAHRLLHWAALEGKQAELKNALFEAYFTDGQNPGATDILVAAAEKAGLDGAAAREVLTSGRYIDEVRADERFWREQGVNAVPAIVLDRKYMILGGQPPEAFERVLRKLAAEEAA